ncbi:MAG TPA: GNAT family N-acetyltransferase [Actinocrinis sp.]|jgi:GNAT superfamily N-acetyltransferase|uniref:GNAT family N-acetyltransferase n=1 Tax=Actinocrinis sp. TaxID=1920516 RepID=UPI002DDCFE73|nr:GNAT family N-acetyltransferase [Actinocrinis sp.]HEV3170618.1 GNAT family N-acetyltransferase [Actinocrinis sp.]
MSSHVLDHVVRESLNAAPHARFAQRHGQAVRYLPDVAPFAALDNPDDPQAWADAAELVGSEGQVCFPGVEEYPPGWTVLMSLPAIQLTGEAVRPQPDPEAVRLGPGDVEEILDLVARTEPGPFLRRTVELGTYLGLRRDGKLIAMTGERMRPPGWTEISAVCTDPAYRGHGLASRLIRAVTAVVVDRGEAPFLHAVAANTNALRLYESLGFRPRRPVAFTVAKPPQRAEAA